MLRNADYIMKNILIADNKNTTLDYCKKTTGVDLSVNKIYAIKSTGAILVKKTQVAQYEEIKPSEFTVSENGRYFQINGWTLPKGTYIIELNEGCVFPDTDAGWIILRSSLNRNGVSLISALWDNGFTTQDKETGDIYGMSCRLTVDTDNGIILEKNARVGQLLVFDAPEDGEIYSSAGHQFQGKGLK